MEQKFYTQIEDYLKGRLSEEDQKQFEAALVMDANLAAEVALQKDLIAATSELDILELRGLIRDSLAVDSTQNEPKVKKGGSPFPSWLGWLLLAAFLIGGAYFIFRSINKIETNPARNEATQPQELPNDSTEKQFSEPLQMEQQNTPTVKEDDSKPAPPVADNTSPKPSPENQPQEEVEPETTPQRDLIAMANTRYQDQPYSVQLKSADPDVEASLLAKAEAAYNAKDFKTVIDLLQTPEEGFESESAKLRAHAYFQSQQFDKAAAEFQGLAKGFYKYDAEWYRLLSLLPGLPATQADVDALIAQILNNSTHAFRGKVETLKAELE